MKNLSPLNPPKDREAMEPSDDKSPNPSQPKMPKMALVAMLVAGVLLVIFGGRLMGEATSSTVPLSRFEQVLNAGLVQKADLNETDHVVSAALVETDDERWASLSWDGEPTVEQVAKLGRIGAGYPAEYSDTLIRHLQDKGVEYDVTHPSEGLGLSTIISLGFMVMMGFFLFSVLKRQGGMVSLPGRSTKGPSEVPPTRFSDVIGVDEAVSELEEVSRYLQDPDRYQRVGARAPKGFLLVGPPGTGKTLLARACAGEAEVPFFAMSGSDFVEMYVGMGAARVRKLFEAARKHDKAIVFIDEIDSVGRARRSEGSNGMRTGSNDEQESTLNALLVEMDGFHKSHIVVIAATNRPDMLDQALLRAGRFDRRIHVSPPDRRGRQQLFEHYLTGKPTDVDLDLEGFARRTAGMCGADIEAVCNDAALECVRQGKDRVDAACLEVAVTTAYMGRERRSALVSDKDREVTAWHEAGHAVAALVQDQAPDPVNVSIVPRGPAGGVTWLDVSDEHLLSESQLKAQLVVALSGRGAERLQFGEVTQGAQDDITKATQTARAMVAQWGMGTLGPVHSEPGLDGFKDHVDDEVRRLLLDSDARSAQILEEHRELLAEVARMLLEKETLSGRDIQALHDEITKSDLPTSVEAEIEERADI